MFVGGLICLIYMLFVCVACSGVQQVLTIYTSNMAGVLLEAGTAYLSRAPEFPPPSPPQFFGGFRIVHKKKVLLCCSIVCL